MISSFLGYLPAIPSGGWSAQRDRASILPRPPPDISTVYAANQKKQKINNTSADVIDWI